MPLVPRTVPVPFPPLWFVLGLPALAAFALYLPVLPAGFVSDDYGQLHAFDGCDGARGIAACVAHMFVSGMSAPSFQYRPLTMLSFALNALQGANPLLWRLVNVVLHSANAALVALLAWQLAGMHTGAARYEALAAGWLFAWFAPGVEAVAWVAARFDGMALFWMLIAACTFVASRRWRDAFGLASLATTALAFLSKEAAAIGVVLIVALAWQREAGARGALRSVWRAPVAGAPWLLVAAAYFVGRALLFDDAFRVYPGRSPLRSLLTGESLQALPGIVDWARMALPGTKARFVFACSGLALAGCAVVAGLRERAKGRALTALAATVVGAFAMLLAQVPWSSNGEGGRVLYAIGAVAIVGLSFPLSSAGPQLRAVAWGCAGVLLASEFMLASAVIERWRRTGDDARELAVALAETAAAVPADGYAFVVIPDHIGAIPFGRNAQGGLMLPPVQAQPLSPKLIVQTPDGLARWPDLFERDIIGRLRREPLRDVVAHLDAPKVPPPHPHPDRYFCWSPSSAALVRLPPLHEVGPGQWDAAWSRALEAAGCPE
jgi:hypothetical protein